MTLKDLIMGENIVSDNDKIIIAKQLSGNACDMRSGKWYNDQVLEFMNAEIRALSWTEREGFHIALK